MNIEKLRELNPNLEIYSVSDEAFKEYGEKIENINTDEIVKVCEGIEMPESATRYEAQTAVLQALPVAKEINDKCFGALNSQIGFCWGYNSKLNALEWHTGSEINIAVTDLVLLLARRADIENGKLDSKKVKAFYVKKGEIIEVFAPTLHYCPCMVEEKGFKCVVGLEKGTNLPLENKTEDARLFAVNKWLLAHEDNANLIARGGVPAIYGENYEVKF